MMLNMSFRFRPSLISSSVLSAGARFRDSWSMFRFRVDPEARAISVVTDGGLVLRDTRTAAPYLVSAWQDERGGFPYPGFAEFAPDGKHILIASTGARLHPTDWRPYIRMACEILSRNNVPEYESVKTICTRAE